MKSPTDALSEILDIIEFQDDKEKFINAFFEKTVEIASVDSLATLPQAQQTKLKEQLKGVTTTEKATEVLHDYVLPDIFLQKLEAATAELFKDFLGTIIPALEEPKRKELVTYLQKLQTELNVE